MGRLDDERTPHPRHLRLVLAHCRPALYAPMRSASRAAGGGPGAVAEAGEGEGEGERMTYLDFLRSLLAPAFARGASDAEIDALVIDARVAWAKRHARPEQKLRERVNGVGNVARRKSRRAPGERASI